VNKRDRSGVWYPGEFLFMPVQDPFDRFPYGMDNYRIESLYDSSVIADKAIEKMMNFTCKREVRSKNQ